MLSITKFNAKQKKKVWQYFNQDDSIQTDELQVTKSQIAQMEEIVNLHHPSLDFSEKQFIYIKQNLQSLSTNTLLSYCYLSLKKILEIPNNPNFSKKLIDSDEILLQESLGFDTNSHLDNISQSNIQESQTQNNTLQAKFKYQSQLFDSISFFVMTIQDILLNDTDINQNSTLLGPILYDITQIYLIQYLRLCRISIEIKNQQAFSFEHYSRGQQLLLLAYNLFNDQQIQNIYNLIYNFRIVSQLTFQDHQISLDISKILKDFLNYHYQSLQHMQQLFKFEQPLKYTFLDQFLRNSNENIYQLLFQEIQHFDQRFQSNCYVLELKWLSYYWFLTSNNQDEKLRQLVKNHINNPNSWQDLFLKLIYIGSKRLLRIFINLEKFQNSNDIMRIWQDTIFNIITNTFLIQTNQQYQQDFNDQLFLFILNYLQPILQYKYKHNQSSKKVLNLLEDSIKHRLAEETKFQKKLFDILITSDLACYGDNIQEYIFKVFSPLQFSSDPITIAKYILLCNQNQCRQKIINHIYCSIIKYRQISNINSKADLNQIIQLLHQMIIYFQKESTDENHSQFLSQQIILSLRSMITIIIKIDVPQSQQTYDQLPSFNQLLVLELPNETLPRNIFDNSLCQLISQFLNKILQLANSLKHFQLEDFYEILILVLKLIYVVQKFMILNDDIVTLNLFLDNIDQSLYEYITKVFINHEKLSQSQIKYIIENFNLLTVEDFLTKNMSSISENNQKFMNYRLLKIFISCIFECDLPSEYKQLIVNFILQAARQHKQQFSTILNKLILLLVIEKNEQSNQIRQSMIEIIKLSCEISFSNSQLYYLLRLCFGESNNLLIFRNSLPDYQYGQQLADQIFENDGDLINIFFEPQLKLVKKNNFSQGLSDFISIFKSLFENNDSYLFFKDLNSYISFPIQFNIQKGFTMYFEIQFLNKIVQENFGFQDSQELIQQENRLQFYDFATLYFKKNLKERSGIQILISKQCVQIRQFKVLNKQDFLGQVSQSFEINLTETSKYKYQINYNKDHFTAYINGQQCKSKVNQIMEINEIIQIDLGKSIESTSNISQIFCTQSFDYETNIFQGKMFNFCLIDQPIKNGSVLELETKSQYLIKFSKLLKIINPFDIQQERESKDLFEINDIIKKKQPYEVHSIFYKQISNLYDVLKNNNIYHLILLIFQEILNQQQLQEYENQITDLLTILFDQIILKNEETLNTFFKQEFNNFTTILLQITSKVKLQKLLEILVNFNEKLDQMNSKYFFQVTNQVIYQFSLFEQFVDDEIFLNSYFFELLKKKYGMPLEQIIEQIIKNPNLQILETKQFFDFLNYSLEKPFSQENKIKHQNLFYKFVSDIQLFAKLFEYQDLNSNYLHIIKSYLKLVCSTYQQSLKNNLQKYNQNTSMINQKNDVMYFSALLKACQKKLFKNTSDIFYWNFINLLLFIEELHKENLQYNPTIVDSLILEIILYRDNLKIDDSVLEIVVDILREIKNINTRCTFINLIALLLNNNTYLFEIKCKPALIDILSNLLQYDLQLFDLIENSMLELIFDSINYKDQSKSSQNFYLNLIKAKITNQHLKSIDLGRLLKILSHFPEVFQNLLAYIQSKLQQNQVKNQVILIANLLKMLNIMKKDCFAKDQNNEFEKLASQLQFFIQLFYEKNFFKFNFKKKQMDNLKIENIISCGGLFGLFSEIFLEAISNKQTKYVINNILKLLDIYLEEMNKKTDDLLVKELYGVFNYGQDKNGIKFPIITIIFKNSLSNNTESLTAPIAEIIAKILKVINEIEQQQEKQLEKSPNIQKMMMDEFNIMNSQIYIESYQNQLQQQYEEYKKNKLDLFQQKELKNTFISTTCDTSLISFKKKDLSESKNSFQTYQNNFLFFSFYFQNSFKNLVQLNQIIKDLNNGIFHKKHSLIENYKIMWSHTNLVDYENKIIFKKQIPLKNEDDEKVYLNSFQIQLESQKESKVEITQEYQEINASLRNVLNKGEDIKLVIIREGITFIDPFNNEKVVISNEGCKVSLMKYMHQEKSFLIKKFDQGCQRFYFFVINTESQFKQLKKHFQNLGMLNKKSLFEIKKNLSQKWQQGQLSNYQYIYLLNSHSGRNLFDKNNYYIFPWTSINYNNNIPIINRNFSQSIFNQRPTMLQEYFHSNQKQLDFFLSINQQDDVNFQTQQFQSSNPDQNLKEQRQDKKKQILNNFINNLQNLGESLPEFYSNPQFFSEFQLPDWVSTQTPEEFVYIMRVHLESRIVQELLPNWIDLIFGIHSQQQNKQQQSQEQPYKDQCKCQQNRNLYRENMNVCEFGQPLQQIFTEKHQSKKLFNPLFENQSQIKITTKRLLYKGDEKIISSYYYQSEFILISEQGIAIILDADKQLIQKIIVECDCLNIKLKKKLETKKPLTHQQICYIDFDNQYLPDKQESQNHILVTDKLSLFQNNTIFFIIAGYPNGEFRSFKGSKLKEKQFNTQNNSNIQCIKFCHTRNVLIIGQEDGALSLWKVSKDFQITDTPFLIISSHVKSITNIDCSVSKILSVDIENEVHIHFYDGLLIKKIQLACYGRITYCQISYTMNLYIFLNSFNKLMVYNYDGQIYIHPIEIPQQINNILPVTPFSSQFIYATDNMLYFDDIFVIKMKQDGRIIEKVHDNKIYNYNFSLIKAVQGQKLILNNRNQNNITTTQIIFQNLDRNPIRFQTVGCENGNFWCLYNEDEIFEYYEKKLQKSGLK
ncbi:unnamed protein product [Paramecium sonneborni]|uniref:BEACH domain-containing protein n=1 Tax=Paramecium sonneborni TaxID=65129 RepID=A0A8S1R1U9_9CILI|nr:unnamed protein product [Paramecium sonneborni]